MEARMRIGFIGAGTVGTALAVTLSERGYPVVAICSRSLRSAELLASRLTGCQAFPTPQATADASDLVFITTPDSAIGAVASQVDWRPGCMVAHCSGADSLDVLQPARSRGAVVGAFHPLQSFASPAQALENLPGSFFALEGDEPVLAILKDMVLALGGNHAVLKPGDKVLYHAAAVFVSNYTVALMGIATGLWRAFGVSPDRAIGALMPLLQGTVNNIGRVGMPNCLTGPIARGDTGTVQKHLSALGGAAPELLAVYRELGLRTIPIALDKGKINPEIAEEMRALLGGAS